MIYQKRLKSHHDAYGSVKKQFQTETDKAVYVRNVLGGEAQKKRALYLHVPFCTKTCTFCPFHKPDELKRREYDDYLIREMDRLAGFKFMEAPIDAVYFGGGTPTALTPGQMERVLDRLHKSFTIRKDAEVSVETSITELSDDMTQVLLSGGVNRLSVGIQTFDDRGRKILGRRGSGDAAAERLLKTKRAGFRNLNLDLIYNWPGETLDDLREDLRRIRELELAGISFYSLMLHENTPIRKTITQEELVKMGRVEWDKEQFDLIMQELGEAGYQPFELTKLIRDGIDRYDYVRVRHSGGDCIALGHGAGGNLSGYHYYNTFFAPPLAKDLPISAMGVVEGDDYFVIDEFINDLQRTKVDLKAFGEKLRVDVQGLISDVLERLEKEGLIRTSGTGMELTRDGIFWGNNVIDEILRTVFSGAGLNS
ncbi:MAG: coproporphyrinogen III oxidase family protein [Acetatifactor sp.]|nr:coproporphyrinogen III oxidase family protein [Acetatifactor sp.]